MKEYQARWHVDYLLKYFAEWEDQVKQLEFWKALVFSLKIIKINNIIIVFFRIIKPVKIKIWVFEDIYVENFWLKLAKNINSLFSFSNKMLNWFIHSNISFLNLVFMEWYM